MGITLEDVACLTNLPIEGDLFSSTRLTHPLAVQIVEDELKVTTGQVEAKVKGTCVSFERLREFWEAAIQAEAAAEEFGEQIDEPGKF
jgi:hypothetical protein